MTYKFVIGKTYPTLEAASLAAMDNFLTASGATRIKRAHAILDAYRAGLYIPSTERRKETTNDQNHQNSTHRP